MLNNETLIESTAGLAYEGFLSRKAKIESALKLIAGKRAPFIVAHHADNLARLEGIPKRLYLNAENAPDMSSLDRDLCNAVSRNLEETSQTGTKSDLAKIEKAAMQLLLAIKSARAPAIKLCGLEFGPSNETWHRVHSLLIAAHYADVSGIPTTAGRGRPARTKAAEIALETAVTYLHLVGKIPTVSAPLQGKAKGPFITLLSAVYEALEVPDAVEARARGAISQVKGLCRKSGAILPL